MASIVGTVFQVLSNTQSEAFENWTLKKIENRKSKINQWRGDAQKLTDMRSLTLKALLTKEGDCEGPCLGVSG